MDCSLPCDFDEYEHTTQKRTGDHRRMGRVSNSIIATTVLQTLLCGAFICKGRLSQQTYVSLNPNKTLLPTSHKHTGAKTISLEVAQGAKIGPDVKYEYQQTGLHPSTCEGD